MTVLETLLRGIRTHEGAVVRARPGAGEEYAVPVGSPLVLSGVVAGELVGTDEALPAGGVAMTQPGAATTVRAGLAGAPLLADPDVAVGAVARRVGHSDAFRSGAAFERERGVAPSTVRA